MLIGKKDQDAIKQRFEDLEKRVKVVMFESTLDCPYCPQTKEIVTELAALTDKIDVETYNFHTDAAAVTKYKIDKVPAIVLLDETEKDYGIRFYGIPSGYEFGTLIEDLHMVSTGKTELSANTVSALQNLGQDVHMQVFVTPT